MIMNDVARVVEWCDRVEIQEQLYGDSERWCKRRTVVIVNNELTEVE